MVIRPVRERSPQALDIQQAGTGDCIDITQGQTAGEFVAVVRQAMEACVPEEPAPLPLARVVFRRCWRDHVVHLLSWPRRAWQSRSWPLRAFTHAEIDVMAGKIMWRVLRWVIYVLPKDRRDDQ